VVYDGRFEAELIGLLNDESAPVSRVHLGVHFPSDAAVGGVIGIGIGTFTAWLLKQRR